MARLAHLLWKTVELAEVLNSIRESEMTSWPFIVHVGLGVGLLTYGTVIVNSSPAITVMSRMLRSLVILGAPVNNPYYKHLFIEVSNTQRLPLHITTKLLEF